MTTTSGLPLRGVVVGAAGGLAWSCALRGWMAMAAGAESTVTWVGTVGGVLAPGAVVGGLVGWAEHRRRAGLPTSRWLVAAPAVLGVAPLAVPGVLASLLETGQGSGAPGMVGLALLAGYGVSGRGPRWTRIAAAGTGFAVVPATWLAPPLAPGLDPTTPQGALAAATFSSLFVVLAVACSRAMLVPAAPD